MERLEDATATAAVALAVWWAPRAVGLGRQSQNLADHSGLGWAGRGPGQGDESTFSVTGNGSSCPCPRLLQEAAHQVCGFVFLQPCDVRLPQGQGHRVTRLGVFESQACLFLGAWPRAGASPPSGLSFPICHMGTKTPACIEEPGVMFPSQCWPNNTPGFPTVSLC